MLLYDSPFKNLWGYHKTVLQGFSYCWLLLPFRERNKYFFTVKLKPYTLPVIALYLQIFNAQNYTLLKISQPRVYS